MSTANFASNLKQDLGRALAPGLSATVPTIPRAAQRYSELQLVRREMHWQAEMRKLHELLSDHHARRGNLDGKRAHERHANDAGQQVRRLVLRGRELSGEVV